MKKEEVVVNILSSLQNTDFADDIALISEHISQTQEIIIRVEIETRRIGLFLNEKKRETMQYNQEYETPIIGKSGGVFKVVDNFKYLGGWMHSTQKDFEIRKALAWSSCHKLQKVWKSDLNRMLKVKRLDGFYTRMLRMALNVSWKEKLTNKELYGQLPPVSSKVAYR